MFRVSKVKGLQPEMP